ncbi:MAG: universal stress protein [Deltaproteobacteria bacterium]|nr:universal stress protein [Deltaproteobacteria bacterium]
MTGPRRSPEDFLELVHRARQGRLKVYLGFAAGVGKTYRMLQEAKALAERGVDIVIAAIDAHGRPDTAALLPGLEAVPLRRMEYRGVVIEELDLDAVLRRTPSIAIVDEVAHTNVPGSRNLKRYRDILELLDARINVLCAFNIQHLESLNDVVERATGIRVRETVPDTFLERADQIVNVDLPVEDLVDRLKAGKIYAHEKIPWALEGFFKSHNLLSLRELTLREIAETLDRAGRSHGHGLAASAQGLAPCRIMVCISSMPVRAAALLRRGSRMAGRLNTHWFVAYVETPEEAPDRISSEAQRHLLDNFQRAQDLGAEVVRLKGVDPVATALDFARAHGVSDIVIGRSRQPWWRRVLGRSPMHRLVEGAEGFDVHIVALDVDQEGRR